MVAYQSLYPLLDSAVDGVDMRDLLVSRVDLAVVEGADSHDNADVVVALAVRLGDSVRRHRHSREVGGGRRRTMGRTGLESKAFS